MNIKSLIVICVCSILVATLMVGAYQLGLNNGSSKSIAKEASNGVTTNNAFQSGLKAGNVTGYQQGYQDGLKAHGTG